MGDTSKCVLVTGGAGYIGSHTTVELVNAGYSPVVVDNLCNSSFECIRRVEEITGQKIPFYKVDLLDKPALEEVFQKHCFEYVVHFAGLKAVGESCQVPLRYFRNNLECTMTLLEVMQSHGVHNIVFSSSATVYGDPQYLPLDELHPAGDCTNPYGRTKYFIEEILSDMVKADKNLNAIVLRYFNPVGAHKSGKMGEDPHGPPNNLMPFVAQVAVGRRAELSVFGNDYNTPDGTGVRDYIHVIDLSLGHVAALKKLDDKCGYKVYNLGTGKGQSVLEMVEAFKKATGVTIPYKICDRRAGDIASMYADPTLARDELKWTAKRDLQEMCEDLWRWQSMNPEGFGGSDSEQKSSDTESGKESILGKHENNNVATPETATAQV